MICLYHVAGVGLFFTESAKEDENGYTFDTAKTALLQPDPNKPGGLVPTKCDKFMGSPTQMFVPHSSVTFAQDCDESSARMLRASLSGLVIVSKK